jgi:cell division cycle 14
MVIVQKQHPDEAFQPLMGMNPTLIPYRDAGYGPATYHLSVLDCLKGLYKALTLGLIDIDAFDLEEYEFYEKVENGDMNWISKKFLALANPKEDMGEYAQPHVMNRLRPATSPSGYMMAKPASKFRSAYKIPDLIQLFKEKSVGTIIRLNNKLYDRTKFLEAGIEHIELYFPDGTTPPDPILFKFLEIAESRPGRIFSLVKRHRSHCYSLQGRLGSHRNFDCVFSNEALQNDGFRSDCIFTNRSSGKCGRSTTKLFTKV